MDTAVRFEIQCDKAPARHHVVPGIVAAIGDRMGTWRVVVHERHAGNCWDVRIAPPRGTERHFVFLGEERTAAHVQEIIERELAAHLSPEP
jgi:hypothetical protein